MAVVRRVLATIRGRFLAFVVEAGGAVALAGLSRPWAWVGPEGPVVAGWEGYFRPATPVALIVLLLGVVATIRPGKPVFACAATCAAILIVAGWLALLKPWAAAGMDGPCCMQLSVTPGDGVDVFLAGGIIAAGIGTVTRDRPNRRTTAPVGPERP